MPKHHRNLTRALAVALAACAIGPGAALAVPVSQGPVVAPAADSGVTAKDYQSLDYRAPSQTGSRADGATKQDLRAPDQTTGPVTGGVPAPTAPQWPVNPQPIVKPHAVATAKPSDDGGIDNGVWIALGAAAFTVAGGLGIAGGKRLRTGRQRQLA
jgi:hypothetical protein